MNLEIEAESVYTYPVNYSSRQFINVEVNGTDIDTIIEKVVEERSIDYVIQELDVDLVLDLIGVDRVKEYFDLVDSEE